MAFVGIALGTNLGEKISTFVAARDALASFSVEGLKQAGIYGSSPVDCPAGSPDFYNTVVEIQFEGTADDLIRKTQSLEAELGRLPKTLHNEPRVIDLDILYFGDLVMETTKLTIPHPRMTQRRFVLEPLAEIRPALILPDQNQTILELLNGLHSDETALNLVTLNW